MYQDSCEDNLMPESWNSAGPSTSYQTSYQRIFTSRYQVPQMSQLPPQLPQLPQQPLQQRYESALLSNPPQYPPNQLLSHPLYQATQPLCQPQYQATQPPCQPQYQATQTPCQPQSQAPEILLPCQSPCLAQLDCQSQVTYQASYHTSSDISSQLPYQSQLQPLYSCRWGQDLYALTEEALHEVSFADHNCPVCQRDHHLTRHRGSRDPPHRTDTPPLSSDPQRPAEPDTVGKILISSNSGQAAIYMNVKFVPNPKGSTSSVASRLAASGSLAGTPNAPQISESDYRKLDRLSKRLAKSLTTLTGSTSSSMKMPSASLKADRTANAPGLNSRMETRGYSEEGLPKALGQSAPPATPPAAPSAARAPSSSAQEQAPPASEEIEEVTSESKVAGTPIPLESESGQPPGMSCGEGEWFTSTLATGPQGQPYKTTIQLLRFTDRDPDKAKSVPAPKRLLPPMFLSRHRPENVVSGKDRGRLPAVVEGVRRTNYSNSMESTTGTAGLQVQEDPMDRQKQLVANAIRLTRLFEYNWGQV